MTLAPGSPDDDRWGSCFFLCERSLADFVRNIILFVPFGLALRMTGLSLRAAIIIGVVVSGAIEIAQMGIPGRFSSFSDVVSNPFGTACGAFLPRIWDRFRVVSGRTAGRWAIAAFSFFAIAVAVTGYLVQPIHTSDSPYYGQWTANLGYMGWYRGRVLEATLDGSVDLPSTILENTSEVKSLLTAGAEIRINALGGPPVNRLSPLFSISDGNQVEILVIGPDGPDLVVRRRTRGFALGLDQPFLRFQGQFRDIGVGDSIAFSLSGLQPNICIAFNAQEFCNQGFSAGVGWSLLLFSETFPASLKIALSSIWLAVLVFPSALLATRGGRHYLIAAVLGVGLVLVAVPPLVALKPISTAEALGVFVGFVLGFMGATMLNRAQSGQTIRAE